MRRYLVVANQTLGGTDLAEEIRRRIAEGPCSFHIVVPATRPKEHLVWTEGEARAIARGRLERALEWFREAGATATGAVGDTRPMLAIEDALLDGSFDEIVISTLPPGRSRWVKQDLVARVRREYDLPVTHVVAQELPATAPG